MVRRARQIRGGTRRDNGFHVMANKKNDRWPVHQFDTGRAVPYYSFGSLHRSNEQEALVTYF